ncbi:hypothetical protein [Castellaniella sp. UC4442_H9]
MQLAPIAQADRPVAAARHPAVAGRRSAVANVQHVLVPPGLREQVINRLAQLCAMGWSKRLWRHDASLWTGRDEAQWLGWLNPARQKTVARRMAPKCAALREAGWTDAVLMGMGGASLGAYVLSEVLGPQNGGLRLHVLDSTDPGQVRELEACVPLARTLFIVASKSGTTLESSLLEQHFRSRAAAFDGPQASRRFCAITDPGTALHRRALEEGYAAVFSADPSIGGRYSVLSPFGMVPLALMGHDPLALLNDAEWMSRRCGPGGGSEPNDALWLGTLLGEAAIAGRDKITLCASADLASLGEWLEQLLAESTGKDGRALVPVCGEQLDLMSEYRQDRVFVLLRGPQAESGLWLKEGRALARAGHPVVIIDVASPRSLGQEFYRWEYATAVAGTLLGVHPFDQPDVEATKVRARQLLKAPDARSPAAEAALAGRAKRRYSLVLDMGSDPAEGAASPERIIRAWLSDPRISYHAILGYLPRTRQTESWLRQWQRRLRRLGGGAVVAGFGPRYLHSCGQLHKGGPACGAYLFLRMSSQDTGNTRTLDELSRCHAAEARADLLELRSRGRPCLSVEFTGTLTQGLRDLADLLRSALESAATSEQPPLVRRVRAEVRPSGSRGLIGSRRGDSARPAQPRSLRTPPATASEA